MQGNHVLHFEAASSGLVPFRASGGSAFRVSAKKRICLVEPRNAAAVSLGPHLGTTTLHRRSQRAKQSANDKTMAAYLLRLGSELGLFSLIRSSRDTKLLCLQRLIRLFAYGASTLILALHLSSLGISDARIGFFMTLTLLGDVAISLLLTIIADGLGRRRILVAGAALMSASGVVFAVAGNYWVLVAASVLGVISPR